MTTPRIIRIFLSSPGDVADERALVRTVIRDLVDNPLLRDLVVLRVVAWNDLGSCTPMRGTTYIPRSHQFLAGETF